ncbi:glutathione S-transferase [Hymenopellis radicata]|nr:glutathione S-transferase [Hymenopellis radicata]
MVLKLYGAPFSTCTKRVAMVCIEKKIPYEFVNVDLATGEHKTAVFKAIQPFAEVPYIDDDGFILYESRAICRYLEEKYRGQGTELAPHDDLNEIALYEQACSIELCNWDPFAGEAAYEVLIRPLLKQPVDMKVFEKAIAKLSIKLDAYDVILGKQAYLAGDNVTLADLYHLTWGVMLGLAGSDIMTQKPNVTRWFKDIRARPSWLAVTDGVTSRLSYE